VRKASMKNAGPFFMVREEEGQVVGFVNGEAETPNLEEQATTLNEPERQAAWRQAPCRSQCSESDPGGAAEQDAARMQGCCGARRPYPVYRGCTLTLS
jgi:hypothetical protein